MPDPVLLLRTKLTVPPYRPGIVAATDVWELHGTARVLAPDEIPAGIKPSQDETHPGLPALGTNSAWGCVVEIRPIRLTIHSLTGQGNVETIDF